MIYHEDLLLAGSIDMVYENDDGTLMIYDWKRSKEIKKTDNFLKFALTECISHLPDTNFWHYSLQLNTYKKMIEEKYGKKVTKLCLVCLHPNNKNKSFQLISVPDLQNELNDLFALRKKEINTPTT
jgi:ATP-dependent exoDNAse (exonuclease V) beta subunit